MYTVLEVGVTMCRYVYVYERLKIEQNRSECLLFPYGWLLRSCVMRSQKP